METVHESVMLDETRRLDRLVTSLVNYGRPHELVLTPVDPCALWDETISACASRAREVGARIVHACPSTDRTFDADQDQLKQVFLNLLLNALSAAPNSKVEVSVDWDAAPRWVVAAIQDQGPGLNAAEVDRVFDLFYTTKGTGSGMGLAISRKIAEDHGGTLTVESSPGAGARFELRLPRPAASSARTEGPAR